MTKGEKDAFKHAMKVFRSLVVDHIDRMALDSEAQILNIFERGDESKEVVEAQVE